MKFDRGLDEPCDNHDGKLYGDHTLREFQDCVSAGDYTVPYEDTPDDLQALLHARFGGLEGYTIADTFTSRSAVLDAGAGPLRMKVPALLLEFCTGHPSAGPTIVAQVAFLAPPEIMRTMGKVIRDSANGAANAAEKGR